MSEFDEQLWSAVISLDDTELNPPANADAIAEFEKAHAFQFPKSHREFLLRGNGNVFGSARLFGVDLDNALDLHQQVTEMRSELEEFAGRPVFPFAKDWGGSYYDLMNASAAGDYPVLYWNHEYSEEPDDLPMMWSVEAADFMEFVSRAID